MLVWITKLDGFLVWLERLLLQIISIALTVILMVQVILRYVFSRPLFWAEEVAVQLLVFMTLFGLSLLIQKRQLIAIDILSGVLRGRIKALVDVLLCIVALGVIGVVAREAIKWILRPEVQMELSPTIQLPIWYNYAVFPLAFGFMLVHQLTALALTLRRAIRGGDT